MNTRLVTAFRVVAFAEAVSWLGLLIGMYIKYVPETTQAGVKIFGPIHGTIFIAYVVLTLLVSRAQHWSVRTTLLALGASIPPFFTVVFELWAKRTGRLDAVEESSTPVIA
jgi:integral membrane protein